MNPVKVGDGTLRVEAECYQITPLIIASFKKNIIRVELFKGRVCFESLSDKKFDCVSRVCLLVCKTAECSGVCCVS